MSEIQEELKGLPRYGPEAAALKLEIEEIEERKKKRQEAEEEARSKEVKNKTDKAKTNKARDDKSNKGSEKPKSGTGRKPSSNVM